ncbi:WD40 repeat domain-containing protein [Paenibacillus sp. FSL R5-0701]|uniref:WD40 repeat domain-containing protein n=1 Tax=Paenibacillus sp. FSL R5-0701 TaxID=2921654 RepID=UPI0030D1B3C5
MSRYPWRNTSEDIAQEAQSQWETPGGAQEKADAAEQAAKDYSDENLNAHIGTGGVAHAVVVAGGVAGFMTGPDKAKLDGVASGANNYIHPATHPPSIIAQDSDNRFVTDAEKAEWNSKATGELATPSTDGLMEAADKGKLDGVQTGAQVNQNSFSKVNNLSAANTTDEFFIVGDIGITVTTNPITKEVRITATGSATPGAHASSHITGGTDVIPNAITNGNAGLMSGSDAQFVRIEGETKAGAQNKADAALISANEYTDGVTAEVSAEVNQALANATANYIRQPGYAATSGTSSAYAVTLDPVPTTLPDGFGITIVPHITNAAGPTLNINDLGATPLKKQDGTAYAAGDLKANTPYTFRKVGLDFLADSGGGEVKINGQLQQSVMYADTIAANDPIVLQNKPLGASIPTLTGRAHSTKYSSDGVYLAVGHTVTPFITVYKISGGTYTKLASPTVLPSGAGYGVAWSSDGVYLAVVHANSPFLTIYKRSGDVFTKLANPSTLPASTAYGVAWSSDGVYLAVVHANSPFLTIYKRSGDTFTKLANPATLPSGDGRGVSFSSDGLYLAVGQVTSPFVTIYKRSGDTFTKLSDPSILPLAVAVSVAWSPNGNQLAAAYNAAGGLIIYKRSGDTFTKLDDPSSLPSGNGTFVAYSRDGNYLGVSNATGAYITLYIVNGDAFKKMSDPSPVLPAQSTSLDFKPTTNTVAVTVFDLASAVSLYDLSLIALKSNNLASDLVDAAGAGYALSAGVANETKDAILIWR